MRFRPSRGLLALMARRLRLFRDEALDARAAKGRRLRERIGDAVLVPAVDSAHHDYWVFPILVDDPRAFVSALRSEGFDSSDAARTALIPAPPGRPELEASVAARVLDDLVIVPCYPSMPDAEIEREARVIREISRRLGVSRTLAYADAVPVAMETERGAEAPR